MYMIVLMYVHCVCTCVCVYVFCAVSPEQNFFSESRGPMEDRDVIPALETHCEPAGCGHISAVSAKEIRARWSRAAWAGGR